MAANAKFPYPEKFPKYMKKRFMGHWKKSSLILLKKSQKASLSLYLQEVKNKYINYKRSLNAKEAYVGFVWATEIVERDAIKKNLK